MVVDDRTGNPERPLPQHLLLDALKFVPQAMVITDAEHTIIFINTAFTALTGYGQDEVVGHNCQMLQGPESDPEILEQMHSCLVDGLQFHGRFLTYRKDGAPFWNALSISPVRGDDGVVSHFISALSEAAPPFTAADAGAVILGRQ